MQKRPYDLKLIMLAVASLVLGIVLYIAAGPSWFSFYGLATVTLVALPVLAFILFRAFRELELSRWPVIAILLPPLLAALVQIGFWLAFFEGGPGAVPLAAARAMILPHLDTALTLAGIIVSALVVWLILRGAMKRGD